MFTACTPQRPPDASSFDRLRGLQRLGLDSNHFDTLPDLTTLTALDTVSVAHNRLTFEDLEPNVALAGGAIAYAPQDTVATLLARTATTVTFLVVVFGTNIKSIAALPGAGGGAVGISGD